VRLWWGASSSFQSLKISWDRGVFMGTKREGHTGVPKDS
jgi:hypothetical protein